MVPENSVKTSAPGFGIATVTISSAVLIDALASGGVGLVLAAGAGQLDEPFGLSSALLRWASLVMLPWAVILSVLVRRGRITRGVAGTIVGLNGLWVVGSLLLLVSGWVEPTALGYGFVLAQALAVIVFVTLQVSGIRRITP